MNSTAAVNVSQDDPLVFTARTPDVGELIREFQRCAPFSDGWNRIEGNDQIRYALWANQSSDGKKHSNGDYEAFPFEGAADGQVFLANSVIDELTAVLVVSFWRAMVRAVGVQGTEREQSLGGYTTRLMEWLANTKLRKDLVREVELSAQYLLTYGVCVLKPTWVRELGRDRHRLTLEQLGQIAAQSPPGSPLAMLPALVLDPAQEDVAVAAVRQVADELTRRAFSEVLGEDAEDLLADFELPERDAQKFVRGLRNEGLGEIRLPYFVKNQPGVTALKPWEDVFFHPESTDLQRTRVFEREWVTEVELRTRGKLEGWDADWIEQAAKCKGYASTWTVDGLGNDRLLNAPWDYNWMPRSSELIEIIHAYVPQVDDDGVRCVTHTILHAKVTRDDLTGKDNLCAKSERLELDHGQMPFVAGLRERTRRRLSSARGIPQLLNTRQREIKVQRDGLVDYTSVSVFPPVNIYEDAMGTIFKFGPAVQNSVTPGREPKFLDIPAKGVPAAFELMQTIEREVANDFGLAGAEVPPVRQQVKQQMLVNTFLLMWTEAFQQIFGLCGQFMAEGEFQRVTGSREPLPKGRAMGRQEDLMLTLDVRELDMEFVVAQYKAIATGVIPLDQDNVVDKGKLVRIMLRSINPSLAQEIIRGEGGGPQQVMQRVQSDLMRMLMGFEPEYGRDDDPTAGMRMQAAQQVMQTNPKIQQALQSDPDFAERVKKYGENIQFNLEQQQNKVTGRVGVGA